MARPEAGYWHTDCILAFFFRLVTKQVLGKTTHILLLLLTRRYCCCCCCCCCLPLCALSSQPGICRWNCERLADALSSIPLPAADTAAVAAAGSSDGAAAAAVEPSAAGGAGGVLEGVASRSILPGAASRKGLAVYDDEYARWGSRGGGSGGGEGARVRVGGRGGGRRGKGGGRGGGGWWGGGRVRGVGGTHGLCLILGLAVEVGAGDVGRGWLSMMPSLVIVPGGG